MDPETPDINDLSSKWESALTDLSTFSTQCKYNRETRYAEWANQYEDGRKHGQDAFPWEGASDLRVYLCDEIIGYQKAILCSAQRKANLIAVPTEASDIKRSKLVQSFVKWMVNTQIQHIKREAELAADYFLEKGIAAVGVFWEKKQCKYNQIMTLEEVAQQTPEIAKMIANPAQDSVVADIFVSVFPELAKGRARKMVRELRSKGETAMAVAGELINRPMIRAYTLDDDLIIPPQATDIECCPYLFRRDYLTPEEMRMKVVTEDWDEGWVEHTIKTQEGVDATVTDTILSAPTSLNAVRKEPIDRTGLVMVVWAYQRLSGEENLPGIYETIFNPMVAPSPEKNGHKGYAKHGLLNYRHGHYPFVIFKSEYTSRRLHESRGIPQKGKPYQMQVKVQQDSRIDNSSMATQPPIEYPQGRKPSKLGPGSFVPTRRRGETGYMERPPVPTASMEVERTLKEDFNRMFGRRNNEEDAQETRIKVSYMVERWLEGWVEVYQQAWALFQQFGEDTVYFQVIGNIKGKPQEFSKGEANEKYDFYLSYDALQTDPEHVQNQLKAIAEWVQVADRNGQVDYNELLQVGCELISPTMAERIISPKEAATEKEVMEEHEAIARMVAGVQENIKMGSNYELRLQVLQQWMQSPGGQKWLQDEVIAEAFQARVQQFQMQLEQRDNAIIGRYGADAFKQAPQPQAV